MSDRSRFPLLAWVPILAGLAFAAVAVGGGWLALLVGGFVAALLLATGISALLYGGDRRIQHFMALGAFLGIPIGLLLGMSAGVLPALGLCAAAAATFATAGRLAVDAEPGVARVPSPPRSWRAGAEVGTDEALLGTMVLGLPMPDPGDSRRLNDEVEAGLGLARDNGWDEKPRSYHLDPPPITSVARSSGRALRLDYEHLSVDSGYQPHPGEPGRERWLSYAANRTAHAWMLRHPGPERPWLVCIHGFQMGSPLIDLQAFRGERLYRELGLNLLLPVLPLHGPRAEGRRSGDGFLGGEPLDALHAEAQAAWDLRRWIRWLHAEGAPSVGVYGLSLGGYNTALLASFEEDLACAIPGIPLSDISRAIWRHGPAPMIRAFEQNGLTRESFRQLLRPVTPLDLEPRVRHEHRTIFGATADRLVTPDHVRDLWEHWDEPEIVWYPGAHVTFRIHGQVERAVHRALRRAGLASA